MLVTLFKNEYFTIYEAFEQTYNTRLISEPSLISMSMYNVQ